MKFLISKLNNSHSKELETITQELQKSFQTQLENISESLQDNKNGLVSESAIAKAEEEFGSFNDDGSAVISPNHQPTE